jgi:hypothetical protein
VPGGFMTGDDYGTAHAGRHDLRGGVQRAVQDWLPDHQNNENFWHWRKPYE